jgi:hypothetical protein
MEYLGLVRDCNMACFAYNELVKGGRIRIERYLGKVIDFKV